MTSSRGDESSALSNAGSTCSIVLVTEDLIVIRPACSLFRFVAQLMPVGPIRLDLMSAEVSSCTYSERAGGRRYFAIYAGDCVQT